MKFPTEGNVPAAFYCLYLYHSCCHLCVLLSKKMTTYKVKAWYGNVLEMGIIVMQKQRIN